MEKGGGFVARRYHISLELTALLLRRRYEVVEEHVQYRDDQCVQIKNPSENPKGQDAPSFSGQGLHVVPEYLILAPELICKIQSTQLDVNLPEEGIYEQEGAADRESKQQATLSQLFIK